MPVVERGHQMVAYPGSSASVSPILTVMSATGSGPGTSPGHVADQVTVAEGYELRDTAARDRRLARGVGDVEMPSEQRQVPVLVQIVEMLETR
jgi:hypothetical protein